MIRHIPNTFTLINLFSGCVGVFACANGNYKLVPVAIMISLIADFLDGFLASALKVKSELGGQLDSLADMVSFGVLPGTMLVQLFSMSNMPAFGSFTTTPISYLGFIFTLFACLRLAKFNLDTRQTNSFIGLATPAATIFVLGLYLFYFQQNHLALPTFTHKLVYQTNTLILLTGGLSYLMISEIPMFAFKDNLMKWKGNEARVLVIVLSIPILIVFKEIGLSVIIAFYVITSLIDAYVQAIKAQVRQ